MFRDFAFSLFRWLFVRVEVGPVYVSAAVWRFCGPDMDWWYRRVGWPLIGGQR